MVIFLQLHSHILCVELNSFHRSLRDNNIPQIKAYQHQLQSIYSLHHYQSHQMAKELGQVILVLLLDYYPTIYVYYIKKKCFGNTPQIFLLLLVSGHIYFAYRPQTAACRCYSYPKLKCLTHSKFKNNLQKAVNI